MNKITENEIYKIDEKLAQKGIPFHARPFHAAQLFLEKGFSLDLNQNSLYQDIIKAYTDLIPEVNFTWHGMGTGLIASVDRVKKVTIAVAFGSPQISLYQGLGFSTENELSKWCRRDDKIITKSLFAFSDMYDLVYGINDLDSVENKSITFWKIAISHLNLIADNLMSSYEVNSAILQSICLVAELSIKGTLLHLGIPEPDLKNKYRHNLYKLANKMCSEKPYKDDQLLLNLISKFPKLVESRYDETTFTRLKIISLALNAQFIAASAIRRISDQDLIENNIIASRSDYFN